MIPEIDVSYVASSLLFATVLCPLITGCDSSKNQLVTPDPPRVTVAQPLKQPVRTFVEQSGVTEAVQTADVRARVRGYIEEVVFQPGQTMKAPSVAADGTETGGDILYRIERDEYEAAYNAAVSALAAAKASIGVAEAQVQVTQATVDQTKAEQDRQVQLKQQGVGSAVEYDAAVAAYKSAEASLSAAMASVELAKSRMMQAESTMNQAKLNLNYTEVRSPIDGQVSKTLVKLGNLVEPGNQLATVTDSREIFVNFSVSDREALNYFEKLPSEELSPERNRERWSQQKVYLARETDEGFPFVGSLDYVDQTGVDVATGTLGLRAKFDNSDWKLLPGLFVRLRLPSKDAYEAILIPDSCVLKDSRRTYVLTVGPNNEVDETPIEVAERIDGWISVAKGLDETSKVIVDGIQKTQKGGTVNPEEITLEREDPWKALSESDNDG